LAALLLLAAWAAPCVLREQLDLTLLAAGEYSVRLLAPQGMVVKRLVRE